MAAARALAAWFWKAICRHARRNSSPSSGWSSAKETSSPQRPEIPWYIPTQASRRSLFEGVAARIDSTPSKKSSASRDFGLTVIVADLALFGSVEEVSLTVPPG